MRRLGVPALSVLALFGLGACGGSNPSAAERREARDQAQLEALTSRFAASIEAQDAEAFCALLAPNDKQRLGGAEAGERRCRVVWGAERNPLFVAKDPQLEIEELSFEGVYATAELTNGGELSFAREGEDWFVHLAPAPGQAEAAGK